MVLTILTCYGYAISRSSRTQWHEAEALAVQAAGGAAPAVTGVSAGTLWVEY
jgi:hypothetical protein